MKALRLIKMLRDGAIIHKKMSPFQKSEIFYEMISAYTPSNSMAGAIFAYCVYIACLLPYVWNGIAGLQCVNQCGFAIFKGSTY